MLYALNIAKNEAVDESKKIILDSVFDKINNILISQNGYGIKWYNY